MRGQGGFLKRVLLFFLGLPTTTLEGRFFLVGLVALGFLATATDRNYVLLVLSVLVAVVFVSVVFSSLNLRGITFGRSLPDVVMAGDPFTVRVRLKSRRRWFPARRVLIKDALQSALSGAESRCYAALRSFWSRLPSPTRPAGITGKSCCGPGRLRISVTSSRPRSMAATAKAAEASAAR